MFPFGAPGLCSGAFTLSFSECEWSLCLIQEIDVSLNQRSSVTRSMYHQMPRRCCQAQLCPNGFMFPNDISEIIYTFRNKVILRILRSVISKKIFNMFTSGFPLTTFPTKAQNFKTHDFRMSKTSFKVIGARMTTRDRVLAFVTWDFVVWKKRYMC